MPELKVPKRPPPPGPPRRPMGRGPGRGPGRPPGLPGRPPEGSGPRGTWTGILLYVVTAIFLVWLWQQEIGAGSVETISYRTFKQDLAAGDVKSVRIGPDEIDGELFVHPASAKAASSEAASSKAGKPTPQTAAKEMPAAGKTAPPEAPPPAPKAKTAAAPKPEPAAPPAAAPPTPPPHTAAPPTPAPSAQPAAPPPSASAPSSAPAPAPSAPATGKPAAAPASPATSVAEKASGAPKEETRAFRTVRVEDPNLLADLERAGIDYTGERPSMWPQLLLSWLLPIGIIALLWFVVFRRIGAAGAGQAALSFGKSRARLIADREVGVTFADVAGCDEAKQELSEVVEFLRRPEHFTALGAKIPKGVLLVGPPGTGKTLLARAAAGEARVPFFSLSGSDFVEMFVGVGAARVRDLFQEAKRAAPCIVFVDELDAIGRARGVHLSNINDEREHTLNQLLVEMDGFEPNSGIVILAATNRPDVLDPALLRPGRFDRQVVLDAPDRAGREAILRVHARGKKLASDVDLGAVARATPGFSGADLANALNEAALLAARRNLEHIGMPEIEEAVEKVVAGPERKSRRLDPQEKRRVAVHEVGHALVAMRSRWADPVHKISIVPRGRAALGYTLQLPTGDRHLLPAAALYDRLRGLLGGRAAEEVVFGDVSTGAENDLEMATAIARRMVCQFGMGKSVGLLHCARDASRLAFLPESGATERDCSEATAHSIDEEVRAMLDEAYGVARDLIVHNREALERAADALIEHETLDHAALRELLGAPPGEA